MMTLRGVSWRAVPVCRRSVTVEGAAIRTGGGGGPVGVQAQDPAPAVDDDQVVERAQGDQVVQRGGPALRAGGEVVDLAHAGGLGAAGKRTMRVAGGDGAAQVGRDG